MAARDTSLESNPDLLRAVVVLEATDLAAKSLADAGRAPYYLSLSGRAGTIAGTAFGLEAGDFLYAGPQVPDGGGVDHACGRDLRVVRGASPGGGRLAHAMGTAWAARLRGDPTCVAVHFGSELAGTPDFHVALNFAGLYRAAVVFVTTSSADPESGDAPPSGIDLAEVHAAYGVRAVEVDGLNAEAVRLVVADAAKAGREGNGPTLIHARIRSTGAQDASTHTAESADVDVDTLSALRQAAAGDAISLARKACAPAATDTFYRAAFESARKRAEVAP